MRPSEYDPYNWGRDMSARRGVISDLRARQPAGFFGLPWTGRRMSWRPGVRSLLLHQQHGKCAACQRKIPVAAQNDWLADAHVDHIVPLFADGRHAVDNLQLLCVPCHRDKSSSERTDLEKRAQADSEYQARVELRKELTASLSTTPTPARDIAAAHGISTSVATGHLVELKRQRIARSSCEGWTLA